MLASQRDTNLVVAGAMLAIFVAALDQTVVVTALVTIAADLGDVALMSWVVTAYLLSSTCATPIAGKLSDMLGRKWLILGSLAIFALGSALSAIATSMPLLIVSRLIQGTGGGAIITVAQAIVADVVAPRERGRYAGYFAIVHSTAAVMGPMIGGVVTQYAGWTWIFWISMLLCLPAILLVYVALRRLPNARVAGARIDVPSVLLFILASGSLLLTLSTGGVRFAWVSAPVIAAGAGAIAFGLLFARRQATSPEPLLPPRFLSDPVIGRMYATIACAFGCYLSVIVITPIFFQIALGIPVAKVGMLLIPMTLTTSICAAMGGFFTRTYGRYKPPGLLGLPLSAVALGVFASLVHHLTPLGAALLLMLVGAGIGPIFPTSMVSVQNAAPRREIGAVTGGILLSRTMGGALATAVATSLVLGLIGLWVQGIGGLGSLDELVRRPLTAAQRSSVIDVFAVLYAIIAAGLALAAVLLARVAELPLRTRDDIVREAERAD
ncbi:MAG: MFS transporter [Alphaproteobacteria bacterium]|nr:MFS transporter [Alphaproteobacteria bacterium]